jgi:hypothetical protein
MKLRDFSDITCPSNRRYRPVWFHCRVRSTSGRSLTAIRRIRQSSSTPRRNGRCVAGRSRSGRRLCLRYTSGPRLAAEQPTRQKGPSTRRLSSTLINARDVTAAQRNRRRPAAHRGPQHFQTLWTLKSPLSARALFLLSPLRSVASSVPIPGTRTLRKRAAVRGTCNNQLPTHRLRTSPNQRLSRRSIQALRTSG